MAQLPPDNVRPGDDFTADGHWNPLARLARGLAEGNEYESFQSGDGGLVTRKRIIRVENVYALLDAAEDDSGNYTVRYGIPKGKVDRSTVKRLADMFDFPATNRAHLLNEPELLRNPAKHRMPIGAGTWCWLTPIRDALDGYPIAVTKYNHAVRDIRPAPDFSTLQYTLDDNDAPTWISWLDVTDCETNPTTFPAARVTTATGSTVEQVLAQHDEVAALAFEHIVTFGTIPITK